MMAKHRKLLTATETIHVVHPHDLPLSCPMDDKTLWSAHPKVYLPIEKTGQAICPYCSCRFILKYS